jgi:ABC-type phosphate/phosphonate transport system ATPase subunit
MENIYNKIPKIEYKIVVKVVNGQIIRQPQQKKHCGTIKQNTGIVPKNTLFNNINPYRIHQHFLKQ